MKKSVLIIGAVFIIFSLTAYGLINRTHPASEKQQPGSKNITAFEKDFTSSIMPEVATEFLLDVDTRFMMTVTRDDIQMATSIEDFLPEDMINSVHSYTKVEVIVLDEFRHDRIATGNSDILTAAQLELLKSVDYSTNILVKGRYMLLNTYTGELEDRLFTPHLTVVPEIEASYRDGKHMLIDFLRENSKQYTIGVIEDQLQPGKVYFTVTKEGSISEVELLVTCGYPSIDESMVELIAKLPGKWEPAENAKGEKVDQQLTLSFGQIGC